MNRIELFDGIINVNPLLFVLNIFIAVFLWIYMYHKYKSTGWLVDFWNISLLFTFIIPIVILFPFTASKFNRGAISAFYDGILKDIDYIYLVNIFALPFVFLGGYIFDTYLISKKSNFLESYRETILKSLKSNTVYLLLLLITQSLLTIIIIVQIKNNVLFNPRAFFHADNSIRPIYNATLFVFGITSIIAGLRILKYKSKVDIFIFIVLTILGMFLGARGAILGGLLNTLILYFYIIHTKLKVQYIVLSFFAFLIFIVGLQSLREKTITFNKFKDIGNELAYGNSFSDLRDFTVVYSKWDKEYLLGKTYLAGLIAFIPRSMSTYRDNWALGVFTINTINNLENKNIFENKLRLLQKNTDPGITVKNHSGMRPGSFGEMYFNFGIIGVFALAFILGLVTKYIDFNIKLICNSSKDPFEIYSFVFLFGIVSCLLISVGFSNFYFSNIILIGLYFLVNFFKIQSKI